MPAVGSTNRIYKLKLNGLFNTTPTLNTFNYRVSALLQPTATEVAENFRDEVLPEIVPLQHSNQTYGSIEVIDTLDVENFVNLAVSTAGTRSGTSIAGFIVCSFRLIRSSRDLRSGWKRFSGMTEEDISGGSFTASYFALMGAQAPGIEQALNIGLAVLPLCLVRDRPTPSSPLIDPDDPTTWLYSDVLAAQAIQRVTSQNTRKFFS